MAFIPKIEYGSGPTTLTFELPPEGDNLKERERSNIKRAISNNGSVQHQFNYSEQVISPKFAFVSESKLAEIRTFMETHALKGNSFDYYEDKDIASFETYTLDKFEFKPQRIIPDNSGGFLYDVQFSFRRTI